MARIPRWTLALMAFALSAILLATAYAQQPPGGGNRGNRGNRGGWGMRGGGGMGMMRQGGSILGLLRNEAVQKEIKLGEEQLNQIKDIEKDLGNLWGRPGEGGGARGNWRDMSDEERAAARKKMEERQKEIQEKVKKIEEQVNDVLEPEQLKRVKEIAFQQQLNWPGALARDPELAKQLGITEEQKKQLQTVAEEMRKGMMAGMRGNREEWDKMTPEEREKSRTETRKKMEEQRKEMTTKMLDVLTAEQKAKIDELKGKPFDLTKLQPAWGPGGGRGGPAGPGGRRGAGGRRGGNGPRGGGPQGGGEQPQTL
ncbi:MAG: Spy/CpxP family protein refolding chaperone [Pirellulales bacterium]|nr:Spy/CpxP family protein refolding chaperone [Pirellulales bacterium]